MLIQDQLGTGVGGETPRGARAEGPVWDPYLSFEYQTTILTKHSNYLLL
jgi:hypothetical protein